MPLAMSFLVPEWMVPDSLGIESESDPGTGTVVLAVAVDRGPGIASYDEI